ncbi:hypothetical protein CHUAL_003412 [Chamberlinius hualienensis]
MSTRSCTSSSPSSVIYIIAVLIFAYAIQISRALPVTSELSKGAAVSETIILSMNSVVGILIAIAFAVCLVLTVVLCLCSCFKKPTNPAEVVRNGFPMSPTFDRSLSSTNSGEFTMFPPAGTSQFLSGSDDVYFEPLPDLTSLHAPTLKKMKGDKPRPVMFSHVVGRNLSFQDWFEDPYANFPRMRLRYFRELGSGWFGQVVEGEAVNIVPNERKTKVVVKILATGANTTDQMYFLHEAKPFRDSSHPNVLKLLGKCLESDPFLIILEHCVFDDLKNYLVKHRSESESLLRKNLLIRMAWNVAAGLQYVHSRGFVITDLAARNCLVTSDLIVKIGDYGNSIEKYKEEYYCAGGIAVPVRWCAPETLRCTETIMETKEVTVEANVWSFGVVLWEIFEFGKLPYFELNDDEFIQKVIIERVETLKRPLTPCRHLDHLYHLIRMCHLESGKRPTVDVLNDLLGSLHSSEDSGDAEMEFESRWNQIHSQVYHEVSNPSSSNPSLLQLEDVPLSDSSLNFVDITHSDANYYEYRAESNDFDVDDASWKRILETSKKESGEIIKMIQEKSQSVQDLMKLTVIDIESGSDSDAPCINGDDSLDSSLESKDGNVEGIKSNKVVGSLLPGIVIESASSRGTLEGSSENKVLANAQPNEIEPFYRFVMKSNPLNDDPKVLSETQSAVHTDFISPPTFSNQRRTSTPHKSNSSFVLLENDHEAADVDALDVFFGDPHMPTLSTINNSTDDSNGPVTNDVKKSCDLTYDLKSGDAAEIDILENSLDEGLEMSEEEGSSYSLLTVGTNRSAEEEDCILMVDLETNQAVLVDVPSVSRGDMKLNYDSYLGEHGINDGVGQSNGHRFTVEKVLDQVDIEEVDLEDIDDEVTGEDELSDQLVISNPSSIPMEEKHDVEADRIDSPEWEASTESFSSICTSPSATSSSSSSSGEFDCSTNIRNDNQGFKEQIIEEKEIVDPSCSESGEQPEQIFRLSVWDKDAVPSKSVLRSYNRLYLNEGKKTVSFHFPSESLVYEYPKEDDTLEDDDDDNDSLNGYYGGGYGNQSFYTNNNRPSWSFVYDDPYADYSTIADWDLGAEEMPELEDFEDEDGMVNDSTDRQAMAKKQRSSWGAIYKLSDAAYEDEEDDAEEEIDEDLNQDSLPFTDAQHFDLLSYFAHYNPNAYTIDEDGVRVNSVDDTPSEEQDENYWLERLISTQDLIENTECPFDQELVDEEEEDDDNDDDEQSLSVKVDDLIMLNSNDKLGPIYEDVKPNGSVEVCNDQEIQVSNSG